MISTSACKISNYFSSIYRALSHSILKNIKTTFNSCIVFRHMYMLPFMWSAIVGSFRMFWISSYYQWIYLGALIGLFQGPTSPEGIIKSVTCSSRWVLARGLAGDVAGCQCPGAERWPHRVLRSPLMEPPLTASLAHQPTQFAASSRSSLATPFPSSVCFFNLLKSWELQ